MKIHLRIMVDLLEASNNLRAPTVRCFVGYGYIGCVYISIGGKLTTSIAIIPQLLFLHTSCRVPQVSSMARGPNFVAALLLVQLFVSINWIGSVEASVKCLMPMQCFCFHLKKNLSSFDLNALEKKNQRLTLCLILF